MSSYCPKGSRRSINKAAVGNKTKLFVREKFEVDIYEFFWGKRTTKQRRNRSIADCRYAPPKPTSSSIPPETSLPRLPRKDRLAHVWAPRRLGEGTKWVADGHVIWIWVSHADDEVSRVQDAAPYLANQLSKRVPKGPHLTILSLLHVAIRDDATTPR
ncbi:hypothetical protein B296_00006084 [Ensete ventricosum]|uniref:Uncharacterized protein n=1 Tax=Ensete ventricosum TaxID=4639 RepID=A0A427BBC6_ENSVE|nr:hypothetical protein B296_00006084 [Ensete ventricosum]